MTLQQYIERIRKGLLSGNTGAVPLPDFDLETVGRMSQALGLTYVQEKENLGNVCMAGSEEVRPEYRLVFSSIELLNYSYAVLHSQACLSHCQASPKADFPPSPSPGDTATFWTLVGIGGRLRQLHLLQSPMFEQIILDFPEEGDNQVIEPRFSRAVAGTEDDEAVAPVIPRRNDEAISPSGIGRIYINDSQYYDQVPELVWNFYLGGQQPAQLWLKERKDSKLKSEDILHYQKIIVALTETDRLIKEIDEVEW